MKSEDFANDHRRSLRTLDTDGQRKWVYAEVIGGYWKRWRKAAAIPFLGFFLVAPWLTLGDTPFMQVDFFGRRLILLGQIFWAHELSLFLTAILGTIFGFYALTAWGGRVFCGWVCPHNIWLEMVFRPLEQLIEGRANVRRNRDKSPWTAAKLGRKTLKWVVFVSIAAAMAATCLGWVLTGPLMWNALATGSAGAWLAMAILTFAFGFNFGWFREQTCLIVCPYGRLQGVLVDKKTLMVGYDAARGEPRGPVTKEGAGDCTNCRKCVTVCPTGIDIRDGLQFECIGCTACIDACDDQMTRIGRPKGLIRYTTEKELEEGVKRTTHWRPLVYMALSFVLIGVAVARVALRSDFDVLLMRGGAANFTVTADTVQNYLRLRLDNKTRHELGFRVESLTPGAVVFVPPSEVAVAAPDKPIEIGFFLKQHRSQFVNGSAKSRIRIVGSVEGHKPVELGVTTFGPE